MSDLIKLRQEIDETGPIWSNIAFDQRTVTVRKRHKADNETIILRVTNTYPSLVQQITRFTQSFGIS